MDLYGHARNKDGSIARRGQKQGGRRQESRPTTDFRPEIDPDMEMSEDERCSRETSFEEAERIALSMAAAFGMSREAIEELRERKRREHRERTAAKPGSEPAGNGETGR